MKHLKKYNESNDSIDNILPIDGSYKRIYGPEYEKIEYKYGYVSTQETQHLIIKQLEVLLDKINATDGTYLARHRANYVVYDHGKYKDLFIAFTAREDDWFIIEMQFTHDMIRFIADGEIGLESFINDFDPNDPIFKNKLIKESITFPEDGSYIKLTGYEVSKIRAEYNNISTKMDTKPKEAIENHLKKFNIITHEIGPINLYFDYQGKMFSIFFEMLSDSWIVIHIMIKHNTTTLKHLFFLCDDLDGVYKFINNFIPDDYIIESIIESITFPDDEGYIELDKEEFTELIMQYQSDIISHNIIQLANIIKTKLKSLDITSFELTKRQDFVSLTYKNILIQFTICPRTDDWILILLGINTKKLLYILCDGENGVQKFMDDFDPNVYINTNINESLTYPEDASFIPISTRDFNEIYHLYGKLEDDNPNLKPYIERLGAKYGFSYKSVSTNSEIQTSSYNTIDKLYKKKFTELKIKIYEWGDNWFTISINSNNDNEYHTECYLCDGLDGLDTFINTPLNESSNQSGDFKRINEDISYPQDESFIKITNVEYKSLCSTYKKIKNQYILSEYYPKLIKKYQLKHTREIDSLITGRINNINVTIRLVLLTDDWICVNIHFGNAFFSEYLTYLCDGLTGLDAYISHKDTGVLNESLNYPDEGSFILINNFNTYTEFLLDYSQKETNTQTNKDCIKLLHKYLYDNNFSISQNGHCIIATRGRYNNSISISTHSDEWILVNSLQGSFLCDQIDGFIKLIDSGILIDETMEYRMVSESIELEIEDASYEEASIDDVIYMWKKYKPCDFDLYELTELKNALGSGFTINEIVNKEFTISIYSHKEREHFILNKMNDGWIIIKSDDGGYYICDQIEGAIKFLKI